MAKIAGDCALLAAEAVRIAATHGVAQAARKLEDAMTLAQSLGRSDFGAAMPAPPRYDGALPPSVAQQADGAPRSGAIAQTTPGAGGPSGVEGSSYQAFRAQLQPTVLGVPLTVTLAIAAIATALVVLIVWLALLRP